MKRSVSVAMTMVLWAGNSQVRSETPDVGELETLTITATRLAQPAFDVPASIDVAAIEPDAAGVNVSESLQGIPGLVAHDRQNYAQDEQISIRGFGARSSFGIRGVRLYADGIPASQPDGQGEVSQFNLTSADRVEVLRGPFSALYGNASGGVIQIFTADGSGPLQVNANTLYGSFDTRRASLDMRGSEDAVSYNVGLSQFATDGSRGHSAAQRTSLQGKFGLDLSAAGKLTLLLNYFDSPQAQDPLGLTQAQFTAAPQQTAPTAAQFNTRKSVAQRQAGAIYELRVNDENSISLMGYVGNRDVLQFQAIPVSVQDNPASPGGVIQLATNYGGVEPRWTYQTTLAGRDFSLIAGLTDDTLSQQRRGYENFIGTTLGVRGSLRRNETDDVSNFDQYLQLQWDFASKWSASAGIRHSQISFSSVDYFLSPGNSSDNGRLSYAANAPVAALTFHANARLNLYAAFGDALETPTLDELAYRPDGSAGLNFALRAARSSNLELGAKFRFGARNSAKLALFHADSSNELVVVANSGGRSAYANAPLTRRAGIELSTDTQLLETLQLQMSYTYLDARVRSAYGTCSAIPCLLPTAIVAAGNRIPAVAPQTLYAALRWSPRTDWRLSLMGDYVDAIYANDTNSAYAGSYALLDFSTDYSWHLPIGQLRGFARLDNMLNRRYAGSVIVNESNMRYFEAGPGRAVMVGLSLLLP